MSGIVKSFESTAGGLILGGLNTSVFVNGLPAAVITVPVVSHGPCPSTHCSGPIMIGASDSVFIEGMPACRLGDAASCGHTATGAENVFSG